MHIYMLSWNVVKFKYVTIERKGALQSNKLRTLLLCLCQLCKSVSRHLLCGAEYSIKNHTSRCDKCPIRIFLKYTSKHLWFSCPSFKCGKWEEKMPLPWELRWASQWCSSSHRLVMSWPISRGRSTSYALITGKNLVTRRQCELAKGKFTLIERRNLAVQCNSLCINQFAPRQMRKLSVKRLRCIHKGRRG